MHTGRATLAGQLASVAALSLAGSWGDGGGELAPPSRRSALVLRGPNLRATLEQAPF